MMATKIPKYRPSLTLAQLTHISNLCKQQQPLTQMDAEIIGIIAPFMAKVVNGAVAPAYQVAPRISIEEQLGMKPDTLAITFAARKYEAYQRSEIDRASCSLDDLELAQLYRYENDLMSVEEEEAYTSKLLASQ